MTIRVEEVVCINVSEERSEFHNIYFEEEGFIVKQIISEDEKTEAYRLRHGIFCGELKWVLQSTKGMESDEFDDNAVFFGVFDENRKLVSFLRLIVSNRKFMMERIFLSLVDPKHSIRKEADTAEISRLCVAPEVRTSHAEGNFGVHKISLLLFKAVYQWCKLNKIRYLYAVTELKIYRLYCLKGFPYRIIGSPTKMPDGVTVVAVMLDWAEFELLNRAKRPELLEWFIQSELIPLPRQLQLHETCLKH